MDHWRNKKEKFLNPRFKWICEYNLLEHLGHSKYNERGKFIAMSTCINRPERSQINKLMIHLKFQHKQKSQNQN
jgi:hypothetical protein